MKPWKPVTLFSKGYSEFQIVFFLTSLYPRHVNRATKSYFRESLISSQLQNSMIDHSVNQKSCMIERSL